MAWDYHDYHRRMAKVFSLRAKKISNLIRSLKQFVRSKTFRYGIPFVSLLVVGSFGLSEFSSIVITKREERNRTLTAEEALAFQKTVKHVDVEEEYEKTMKKLDIENWENKRGPRPWEE